MPTPMRTGGRVSGGGVLVEGVSIASPARVWLKDVAARVLRWSRTKRKLVMRGRRLKM
jgi:hypothetical protein